MAKQKSTTSTPAAGNGAADPNDYQTLLATAMRMAARHDHRIFADRLAFSIWADLERLAKKGGAP